MPWNVLPKKYKVMGGIGLGALGLGAAAWGANSALDAEGRLRQQASGPNQWAARQNQQLWNGTPQPAPRIY